MTTAAELHQRLTVITAAHRWLLERQSDHHAQFLDACRLLTNDASAAPASAAPAGTVPIAQDSEALIDRCTDTWLDDHRPNWTVPTMPMMSIIDTLASAAARHTGATVVALTDVRLLRWLPVPTPVRTKTRVTAQADGLQVQLWAWRTAATATLSRFELVAQATVRVGSYPRAVVRPFPPLNDAVRQPNPYTNGTLFHGPRFHYLTEWSLSAQGATGTVDASAGSVPRGLLHQGLLDGALHVIPAQALWQWSPTITRDTVAIPHRLDWLTLYAPLPDRGQVRAEARFDSLDDADGIPLPAVHVQLVADDQVLVAFRLILGLLSLGRLAHVSPADRRTFLDTRRYIPNVGLSTHTGDHTTLSAHAVAQIDWPPGAVADLYGIAPGTADRVAVIAAKEHLAHKLHVHPAEITIAHDLQAGWIDDKPQTQHRIDVTQHHDHAQVRTARGLFA